MRRFYRYMIASLCAAVLLSCSRHENETSFYFWRTRATLDSTERAALKSLDTKLLYVRLFDVDLDKESGQPIPLGVIQHPDSLKAWELIPVVYITNRTMLATKPDSAKSLAKAIFKKIHTVMNGLEFHELQIDCDWSDHSREAYFKLLETLKVLAGKEKQVSATIRLHQVKYRQRTGIPPADKGMLMFYNMGHLNDAAARNSIYNTEDADRYVSYASSYPLHLDVALPIFSWQVHSRKKKIIALLSKEHIPDQSDTSRFVMQAAGNSYRVKTSFLQDGHYFMEQDELRTERLSAEDLLAAAQQLQPHLASDGQKRRIVFFDLDHYHLSYYGTKTLEKTVAVFN